MKRISTLLLAIVLFITMNTKAQSQKTSISVGGGISTLSASNNPKASIGVGADILIKRDFSDHVQGFAQTGYTAYNNNGYQVAYIPLLVGLSYIVEGITPGIGIGYASSTAFGSTIGGFTISPQVGYSSNKFDFIIHYTKTNTNINTVAGGNWHVFGGMKILYRIF